MRLATSAFILTGLSLVSLLSSCGAREGNSCDAICACANVKRLCANYDDSKCMVNSAAATEGIRECVAAATDCVAAENCPRKGNDGGS